MAKINFVANVTKELQRVSKALQCSPNCTSIAEATEKASGKYVSPKQVNVALVYTVLSNLKADADATIALLVKNFKFKDSKSTTADKACVNAISTGAKRLTDSGVTGIRSIRLIKSDVVDLAGIGDLFAGLETETSGDSETGDDNETES